MKTQTIATVLLLGLSFCEAKLQQPYNELQFKTSTISKKTTSTPNDIGAGDRYHHIRDGDFIVEPYKSLIQTTARYALQNSRVSKYFNVDKALNLINDAGHLLLKSSYTIVTATKIVAAVLVSFTIALFMIPEAVWRNPAQAFGLDKYISNGIYDKSILAAINASGEELLAQVGLDDANCRQLTFCQLDTLYKVMMPAFARAYLPLDVFATNLSNPTEATCNEINLNENRVCLASFLSPFLNAFGITKQNNLNK